MESLRNPSPFAQRALLPPLTSARRIQVNRNTRGVQGARARIPAKEGISRIAAIVYVAPKAEWGKKILSAELGGVEVEK